MTKTTLNINKKDVYYTLINGNVYACRFKAILIDIHGLSERNLEFNDNLSSSIKKVSIKEREKEYPYRLKDTKMVLFGNEKYRKLSDIGVDYISLEIGGGIGECSWTYRHDNKTFSPYKIYRSIKDCISGQNPIFCIGYNDKPCLKEEYKVSLRDILPKNIFYEYIGCDFFGNLLWSPHTYRWNGINAVIKHVYVRQTHLGYKSAYSNMLFNLLEERFIFDEGTLETSYATEEECKAHNSVKVFTF